MGTDVDVAVLGDGPAGSVAALSLAQSGARVVLLGSKRGAAAATRTGQCLPAQGWTWMRALGLADAFQAGPHLPIVANRAVWTGDEIEARDLIRGAHGGSWLLDRSAFDTLLRRAAKARGVLHRQASGRIRVEGSPQGWRIEFQTGSEGTRIDASFALDTSGRASALALRHGAKRCVHDRLLGVVTHFTSLEKDDVDQTTLVEAVDIGWWYTCRLAPRQRLAILFTDSDLLPRGWTHRDAFVSYQMNKTRYLRPLLAENGYTRATPPQVVLANSVQLDRPGGSRWLAAGDAAACYDPLSGHGLIAAMDTGRHAAAALVSSARGEASMLRDCLDTAAYRYDRYLHMLRENYTAQPSWSSHRFWARRRDRH